MGSEVGIFIDTTIHAAIPRTYVTVMLWQDRLQYTARRLVTTGRPLHNTRPAVFTLLSFETHRIYDKYSLQSAKNFANHMTPGEAKAPHPATVTIGTMEPTHTNTISLDHRTLINCASRSISTKQARLINFRLIHQKKSQTRGHKARRSRKYL